MVQNSEVLTGKVNRLSLISTGKATALEDYPVIAERELVVNMTEQSRIVEEKIRVSRATPGLVSTLAEIINWLSHLGTGRIHDRCLESRHHIYQSLTLNRIRF